MKAHARSISFVLFVVAGCLLATKPLGSTQKSQVPTPVRASYAIVVNPANRYVAAKGTITSRLRNLFLKAYRSWPGGRQRAVPFSRKPDSPIQIAFEKKVLAMSKVRLARHWLRKKAQDGSVPPKAVSSARMLEKYLAKYKGGVGYMTIVEAKKYKLRILLEF